MNSFKGIEKEMSVIKCIIDILKKKTEKRIIESYSQKDNLIKNTSHSIYQSIIRYFHSL